MGVLGGAGRLSGVNPAGFSDDGDHGVARCEDRAIRRGHLSGLIPASGREGYTAQVRNPRAAYGGAPPPEPNAAAGLRTQPLPLFRQHRRPLLLGRLAMATQKSR